MKRWLVVALLLAGCRQEMADDGRLKPLSASSVFGDGMAARPPVDGTVARDQGQAAAPFATGVAGGRELAQMPLKLTAALLARGRERYDIYCAACHDRAGTAQGMIVMRGFPAPPSLHLPRLRQAPLGHFVAVISQGSGRMYDFANRVPPADRWAIAAYIRALQLSQHATLDDVPAQELARLKGASS